MRKKEREKEKHVPNIAKAFLGQGHSHFGWIIMGEKQFKRCINPVTCQATSVVHDRLIYMASHICAKKDNNSQKISGFVKVHVIGKNHDKSCPDMTPLLWFSFEAC